MKKCFLILALCLNAVFAGCGKVDEDTTSHIQDVEKAFPDPVFRRYVLNHFDINKDGKISDEEALRATTIDVSNSSDAPDGKKIKSLEGVQYFTNLKQLDCHYNQLTSLDVSKNTALTTLYCYANQLTKLDVSKNIALEELSCHTNQLTTLDVSKNTALEWLFCTSNQLTTLDVSHNTMLVRLVCASNRLTTLDVSKTNLGNSTWFYPLSCGSMPTLQTLTLKRGWSIDGITTDRSENYIPEQTRIVYVD